MSARPRVAIVGAGFAGLWAARTIAQSQADVLLFDRNNYHAFFPLLYQVAAAELEPEDITYPVRTILRRQHNVHFRLANIDRVDLEHQVLELASQNVPYDYFILATGSAPNFFGVPGASDYAFSLRTLQHGINLRNHILSSFEQTVHEPNAERQRRLVTFIIVGGGPTGVEFAGALSELIHGPLKKDYRTIDFAKVRVILLEAGGGLLPRL